jgi:predicted CoA-binding protein
MRRLIDDFLSQKRIAIVGVTRSPKGWGRSLYNEFRKRGYDTYAVNPARVIPGIQCYARLRDLPTPVDGAVLVVPPKVSDQVVRECAELGIRRVWLHRGIGTGAVSEAAIQFCQEHRIAAVHGVCPLMYLEPCMIGHRLHHAYAKWRKSLPDGA